MSKSTNAVAIRQQNAVFDVARDREVRDLLHNFQTIDEGFGSVTINRMPTLVEREMMTRRLEAIDGALTPIMESDREKDMLLTRLGLWLNGYTSLQNADHAGMMASFRAHLQTLPWFAVDAAITSIQNGSARERDRDGHEVPLSPKFAPSSQQVYEIATAYLKGLHAESDKIRKVQKAKQLMRPEATEESKRRVGESAAEFVSRHADEENRERTARAAASAQRDAARIKQEDDIALAEYRVLGIKPQMALGRPVTVELLRRTNPDYFRDPKNRIGADE